MVDPKRRGPLQRVPPHDLEIERALLGTAMNRREVAELLANDTTPGDFYNPSHVVLADAICTVQREGTPVEPATVAAHLRRHGQLDAIRTTDAAGTSAIAVIYSAGLAASTAPRLVGYLRDYSNRRRTLELCEQLIDAVYTGTTTEHLIGEMHTASTAQQRAHDTTWEPVNLAAILAGDGPPLVPAVLTRTDGAALLYPGRIHALNGEPESGKSWLALLASQQQITQGSHVLYIDYEDAAESVVERLLALGVTPAILLERFHYIRPNDPIDSNAKLRVAHALGTWPVTLAVIDGVTEAMSSSGWSINDNDDVARFYDALPRLIERHGPAVALIDHVTKDRETRGRYAIGGQHKLAGITGAAYSIDVRAPFGRGLHGIATVTVTKDRHGQIRSQAAGGRHVGELHLHSHGDQLDCTLRAPLGSAEFRPTFLMERISRALEVAPDGLGIRQIRSTVSGKAVAKDQALSLLLAEGFAEVAPGPRGAQLHRTLRPFREAFETPGEGPEEEDF